MAPHQKRLIAEKAALDKNRDVLNAFRRGEIFPTLSQEDRDRYIRQERVMAEYSAILGEWIAKF